MSYWSILSKFIYTLLTSVLFYKLGMESCECELNLWSRVWNKHFLILCFRPGMQHSISGSHFLGGNGRNFSCSAQALLLHQTICIVMSVSKGNSCVMDLTKFHFLLQAWDGITRFNKAEFELSIVYFCITDLKCSVTSVDPISWREATAALLHHQMICMVMYVWVNFRVPLLLAPKFRRLLS